MHTIEVPHIFTPDIFIWTFDTLDNNLKIKIKKIDLDP